MSWSEIAECEDSHATMLDSESSVRSDDDAVDCNTVSVVSMIVCMMNVCLFEYSANVRVLRLFVWFEETNCV